MNETTSHSFTDMTRTSVHDERLLWVLRGVMWITVGFGLLLVLLNLRWFYDYVRQGVLDSPTLMALGVSPDFWAWGRTIVRRMGEFIFFSVSIGILIRTRDLMALLIAGMLALLAPSIGGAFIEVAFTQPVWQIPAMLVGLLSSVMGALVLFTLPSGEFIPRQSRWLLFILLLFEGIRVAWGIYLPLPLRLLSFVPFVIIYSIGLSAQVYRYRHGTLIYRYQFQWIILGGSIAVLAIMLNAAAYLLLPSDLHILSAGIDEIGAIFLALGMTVAVTRYRLFDIDLFINRGMVYVSVALLLGCLFALLFAGQVILLESLLPPEAKPLVLVPPALLVGALYNPTRRRIQNVIDRRFFGLRFNLDQLAQGQHRLNIQFIGGYSGRILGGYELLDVIGRGGMGEVYKGVGKDHLAAIKILPLEDLSDYVAQKRFEREMAATQALRHPNIVETYSAGETDGAYYLALEYLNAGDLKDLLRQHERLSLALALPLLTDIAAALDYAHGQGYVHRDLKLSNIMLRRNGTAITPVIMDFGLTKFLSDSSTLTGEGAVGTIDYMAPEQIQSARQVDQRADIYALGVIAFELLTGERPFKGNPAQILFAHLKQPPPYPHDLQPQIPLSVSLAIVEALSKDPADRPARAGLFVARLREALPEAIGT